LALNLFFGSVVVNAVLGIVALLVGEFGDVQGKILWTSLSVSAASVLSLAMFPAREKHLLGPIPNVGIGFSILGFALLIVLAWTNFGVDPLWRLSVSALTFAFSTAYASLIALAVLQPNYEKVVRSAYVLASVLSVSIVAMVWIEPRGDIFPQFIGVVSILLAAATVSIPVLHRMSRAVPARDDLDPTYEHVYLDRMPTICLNCGASGISIDDAGTFDCESCDARFRVEIPG
jgi:hypothetical protein